MTSGFQVRFKYFYRASAVTPARWPADVTIRPVTWVQGKTIKNKSRIGLTFLIGPAAR
jgi:hypothetical protein